VILNALAKNPGARHTTALQLLEAAGTASRVTLSEVEDRVQISPTWVSGYAPIPTTQGAGAQSVAARPVYEAGPSSARHIALAVAAGVGVVVLLAIVGWPIWRISRPPTTGVQPVATVAASLPEIAPTGTSTRKPVATPTTSAPRVYTVQSGDTLYSIAQDLGVDVADLIAANPGIAETGGISVGQTLAVPSPSAGIPTGTRGPRIYDIHFCDRPCNENGANEMVSFPEHTISIYASWSYAGLAPGVAYSRTWSMGGEEWVHYDCIWEGPPDGTFAVRLWDSAGLRSGRWDLTISIQGRVVAAASTTVEGSYEYWEAAGLRPCPDF
jgi:LysM repeat protein